MISWQKYPWLTGLVLAIVVLAWVPGAAQRLQGYNSLLFYQLNTSHGLSDNYINDMAIDSSGNLWVGTGDGLNLYNGKSVTKFFRNEYPQLTNDGIRQIVCDSSNRIWVLTVDRNATLIDENRRFHAIHLMERDTVIPVRRILHPGGIGAILFVRDRHYQLKPEIRLSEVETLTLEHLRLMEIEGFDSLYQRGFFQVENVDEERYVFTLAQRFFLVNYRTRSIERVFEIPDVFYLTQWQTGKILIQDKASLRLALVNLADGAMTYPFDDIRDQHGKQILGEVTNAKSVHGNQILLTTRKHGIYLFHRDTELLMHYTHNAADPTTIVNNAPFVITTDRTGWVFLGATPNGISYYKSNAVVGQQSVFMDASGNVYDGFVNTVATLDNDTYYIGAADNLIKWRRSINKSTFIQYRDNAVADRSAHGIFFVAFDAIGQLWVSAPDAGIYVLDQDMRQVRHLMHAPDVQGTILTNRVRYMAMGPDDHMWLHTDAGVCRVHIRTFEVDRFEGKRLSELKEYFAHQIWFANSDQVWLATGSKGAWRYTISTDELVNFNSRNGLITDEVFCFNRDQADNTYIGTVAGLQILLSDGSTMHISKEQGLLNNRVEAILRDQHDRIWMGNDVGLSCFNLADSTLKVFDERYGLSVYGFRLASYHQNSDGELIWGTERGIQYFYPDVLYRQTVRLPPVITRVETRDVIRDLTHHTTLQLSPQNNYVTFYFSTIDFSKHIRTFYRYRLDGLDEEWIHVSDQNFVRYNSLRPGRYVFHVQASNDDATWVDATNTVTIELAKPLWMRGWFKMLMFLGTAGLVWYAVRAYRHKHRAQQDELETQVVINYFASRINSYRKTSELLWDVAENCISKLHFEDCVIYLLDAERNVLVQAAAYGPKMAKSTSGGKVDFSVQAPIEIAVGKGIVGTVAQSGVPELISNTQLDARYIVDDRERRSELAVPMKIDEKTIGVIDTEHSRKQFFTQKHLNILSTIAALCANQIQRVRAEEEKQEAMIEVLKNKQKVTESRLQSLRLQMNPHFLFNALNSIQQMILANEEMVATRYLSRFSKLLRTILIHSDKEMVTLREEIDILKLYVDLESVRFKDAFRYDIRCDDDLDLDEIRIPTLLIQPFVENAIWHGLMHKEGERLLFVNFFESDDVLHCIVEDNGIGREKAREMKINTGSGTSHTSKGIAVSLERLKNLNGWNGREGTLQIVDLRDNTGQARGTRVEIHLPLLS